MIVDTSSLNIHELRDRLTAQFSEDEMSRPMRVSIRSFTSVLGTATTRTSSVSSTASVGWKHVVHTASGSWARSAVVQAFHSSSASPTC